MISLLTDEIRVAKKHYRCDACDAWLDSNYGQKDVDADDWLTVEAAEACGWKILPSTEYRYIRYVEDGRFITVRHRLDMERVCYKYELFDAC